MIRYIPIINICMITIFSNCTRSENDEAVIRLDTYNSMKHLAVATYSYREEYGYIDEIIDSRDLVEILKLLDFHGFMDLPIKDQWQNFFLITETIDKIIIRSLGPNGEDDYGIKDDIILELDLNTKKFGKFAR